MKFSIVGGAAAPGAPSGASGAGPPHGGRSGASFREALFAGQPPGGGLFVPESVPRLSQDQLASLRRSTSFAERARILATHLLGDEIAEEALSGVVGRAFDFPVPLTPAGPRVHVLELFHGPTCAFKDFGARFMAQTMAALRASQGGGQDPVTIVAATSGDTGGAVARAFLGSPGVRVVVLYPQGRVSSVQEAQIAALGGNVTAIAVQGDFDDCQRLAKEAFADPELRTDAGLASANSINVGRLLPQTFYYAHAWAELPESERERGIVFSVPSGNCGNLVAGLLARRMGIPATGFVAAANANAVLPEYLSSGVYEPRSAVPTLSTAMDVGNPSNFPRVLHAFAGDLSALRAVVSGSAWSDQQTRACIRRTWRETSIAVDPHTAVGLLGLQRELGRRPQATGIALATAHPAKFPEVVEAETGCPVPMPEAMARLLDQPRRSVPMAPTLEAFRDLLSSLSAADSA